MRAGAQSGMSALRELVDRALPPAVVKKVQNTVVATLSETSSGSMQSVTGVKSGRNAIFDVQIEFAPEIDLATASKTCRLVTDRITKENPNVKICRVVPTTSHS
jgi:divalent metal cation (Fe/Co/Zn/Cd) transporter